MKYFSCTGSPPLGGGYVLQHWAGSGGALVLGDIDLHFAWQVWHFWHWSGSGGALGPPWSRLTPWAFLWQAWHLVTSTALFCHTHLSHTQLCHTSLSHTTLSRATLSHTTLSHNSFTYYSLIFSILHHLLCFSCLLHTTSTTVSDHWKKLTCGVMLCGPLLHILTSTCASRHNSVHF